MTKTPLEVLQKIEILSELSPEELQRIHGLMKTVHIEKEKTLFHEGEDGDELFIVLSGSVNISVKTPDGVVLPIADITGGNFFGEMSIFEQAPRSATCCTRENTTLLSLSGKDFYAFLKQHPETTIKVMHKMLTITSQRLQETGAFLSDMVTWGEEARRRAVTDELTGLYNRRFLDDALEERFEESRRQGRPLSLVMVDLDYFGALNKEYGQEVGDRVIVEAVQVFRSIFGTEDILARYGGDEFTFILMDRGPEEALSLCTRLARDLRELPVLADLGGRIKRVSASIGITSFPDHADSLESLKEKTDRTLYRAKELGRDRAELYDPAGESLDLRKQRIATIAEKNRITDNIITAMVSRDNFVLLGHKNPDEDCIASMVAFSVLLSKFSKSVTLVTCSEINQHFHYLLNICKYNSIAVLENCRDIPANTSTLVVFDTAKPALLEDSPGAASLLASPDLLKIEIDHHLEADSTYIGDPGYRLVDEASSASELVGYIGFKLRNRCELLEAHQIVELFSRNLVLAILTGIIGDSKMGKYLKTSREKWFYKNFSTMFNAMLASKTYKSSRNFSTMEEVFSELEKLSEKEDLCYRYMIARKDARSEQIYAVVLREEDTAVLTADFDPDTIITVARYTADRLAEESGCLSLVAYYDDSEVSRWIQFRMRRSQSFKTLDLRRVLKRFEIANGGGHPGAIGFRLDREEVTDIDAYTRRIIEGTEEMVRAAKS